LLALGSTRPEAALGARRAKRSILKKMQEFQQQQNSQYPKISTVKSVRA
jgi:hypothetical protein